MVVEEDSIWELDEEDRNKLMGGEVRLLDKDSCWIEITKEDLENDFEEVIV